MAGMASMLLLAVLPAADAALTRGWKRAPTGAVVRSRLQGLRATAVAPSDAPVVPSEVVRTAVAALQPVFADIDMRTEHHLRRLLAVFRKHNVGPHLFAGVDGYGNGDLGREALDGIYAELMGAEAAVVRVQIFSGTHAIACALFGVLRPGDEMLTVSGPPYDTLEEVIGLRGRTPDGLRGSLLDFGATYSQIDLTPDGAFDYDAIAAGVTPQTKLVHVQRSCGYSWRRSIPVAQIGELAVWLKERWPHLVLFVDNCYGEFVEELEPCAVGADLIAGSLIKNPGGTLAPSGGYVAGAPHLVAAAARRLSAPGVEGGATLGQNRVLFQGLFHAPQVVGEALKGANLVASVMDSLGYDCNPPPGSAARTDIVQSVRLGDREKVLALCRAVQRSSPVNSAVLPIPGASAGYGDEVIFADGTFVEGSTLELSADGPLREPFAVYLQGCTHWTHWKIVLEEALAAMQREGLELRAGYERGAPAAKEGRYSSPRKSKRN